METNLDTEGLNIMVKFSEVVSWMEALALLCVSPVAGYKLCCLLSADSSLSAPLVTLAKVASSKTDNV